MSLFNKLFVPLGFFVCTSMLGGTQFLESNRSDIFAASVIGIVTDENGDGIENVKVVVESKKKSGKKKRKKTTLTDVDGSYEVEKLKKGKHKVTVSSVGYENASESITIKKNKEEFEKDFTLNFASYTKTADTSTIDAAVSDFSEIGSLRRADPMDGNAIATAYEGELQDLTKEMDSEYGLSMDSDITSAIEDIKNDVDKKLAAQVIDKTLQRVFYLYILERITHVRDEFDDEDSSDLIQDWDHAYAAYIPLIGTADRDNKVITSDRTNIDTGSNPNLEDQILVAFIRGKEALKKKNPTEDEITVGVQRQVIRLSLVRAFYIAVLREVEAVLDNRDTNTDKALEVQKEGEVYYRIIEEYVSRDNPTGSETIKSQFTGDLSGVDADTIVSELSKGFIGRVEGELESNESVLNAGNRLDAMVTAEEALLYSRVFLEDLEIRLGLEEKEKIEDALHDLRHASDSKNKVKADTASQTIRDILDSYENELL